MHPSLRPKKGEFAPAELPGWTGRVGACAGLRHGAAHPPPPHRRLRAVPRGPRLPAVPWPLTRQPRHMFIATSPLFVSAALPWQCNKAIALLFRRSAGWLYSLCTKRTVSLNFSTAAYTQQWALDWWCRTCIFVFSFSKNIVIIC